MHVAILTFEGFNELDSLIALGILNRVKRPAWRVSLACPTPQVRSMNGVVIEAQGLVVAIEDRGDDLFQRRRQLLAVATPVLGGACLQLLDQPFRGRQAHVGEDQRFLEVLERPLVEAPATSLTFPRTAS